MAHIVNQFITTRNGRFFFDNLEQNKIDFDDIAWSLSMQCRYNGHVNRFYSVADHCNKIVEHILEDKTLSDDDQFNAARLALLHDATEAYIGDMVKPLKIIMPEFIAYENRLFDHIVKEFGLDLSMLDHVDYLDKLILGNEMDALLWEQPIANQNRMEMPYGFHFVPNSQQLAYETFTAYGKVFGLA